MGFADQWKAKGAIRRSVVTNAESFATDDGLDHGIHPDGERIQPDEGTQPDGERSIDTSTGHQLGGRL